MTSKCFDFPSVIALFLSFCVWHKKGKKRIKRKIYNKNSPLSGSVYREWHSLSIFSLTDCVAESAAFADVLCFTFPDIFFRLLSKSEQTDGGRKG